MESVLNLWKSFAGVITPDINLQSVTASNIVAIPGSWPEEDALFEDVLEATFVSIPHLKGLSNRALVATSLLYLVWAAFWIISGIAWLVPVFLCLTVLYCFGVVATVTTSWSVGFWACGLISGVLTIGPIIWVELVYTIMRLAQVTEQGNKSVKSLAERLALVVQKRQVNFSINVHAVTVTAQNLHLVIEHNLPAAVSAMTYVLFCPSLLPGLTGLSALAFVLVLTLNRAIYAAIRKQVKGYFFTVKVSLCIIFLSTTASDKVVNAGSELALMIAGLVFYPFYWFVWRQNYKMARRAIKLLIATTVLKCLNWSIALRFLATTGKSEAKGLNIKKKSLRSLWNNVILDLNKVVDSLSVPEFIRSLPDRFDASAINETQEILADLGWPAAEPVTTPVDVKAPENVYKYIDSVIGTTSIRQGVTRLELTVAKELWRLKGLAPEYKRSEQFATEENELESLARYFESAVVDMPEVKVDEVFVLVGDIFRNSRLTPFNKIVRKWEKKYGLGPFWSDLSAKGRWRKLKRSTFIKSIGGIPAFLKLWAKTFKIAPALVPVAPISVKGEALAEKKWRNDVVRTVIGAPLVHYISSTLWNYFPNHNFKYWSTNIKVGMPLNGANISRLVSEHEAYDHHFAGDFTAFDSTVGELVAKIIAGVRKKGFERHRDYAKICFLVDANYSTLLASPMMTTSTGNIYRKKGGLSTGHSSTSIDNSLAVTIYYLAAWKVVTGLSAHEFRHYCKLSNYGDDHLLSWHGAAPPTWTAPNIMRAMGKFGIGIRDEEPSKILGRMSFLSKMWRKPNSSDEMTFLRLGIPVPGWIVYHDVNKLVGKAYAPSKDVKADRDYRMKRLVSYLSLTAHHPDVYDKIRESIEEVRVSNKGKVMKIPVPVPTYDEVLKSWYDPKTVIPEEDVDVLKPGEIIDYSMDGLADTVVNILSVIPDFLNPAIYNMGYTNHLISLFRGQLGWPVHLVKLVNSAFGVAEITSLLKKTPYSFLADSPSIVSAPPQHSVGGLLMRHWIFCMLCGRTETSKVGNFLSYFDSKVASFNFVLNGHVQTIIRRFDVPWWRVMVISALHFMPDIDLPEWILWFKAPSMSEVVEYIMGYLLNVFWSKIPANMKQAMHAIDTIGSTSARVLVEAPTGVGKSTSLVATIYRNSWFRYEKIIMIVPRSLLVTSLCPYLIDAFGVPAHPVTEGCPYDPDARFIVCTGMEVLLHPEWIKKTNLFIWDECHLEEGLYLGVGRVLIQSDQNLVMTTATPSRFNLDAVDIHCPLTIASTWSVDETMSEQIDAASLSYEDYWVVYRDRILKIIRGFPHAKFLVFIVDKSQATYISQRFAGKVCVLSSESKTVLKDANLYIATAVADVGLTIPAVDWVITSNIVRESVPLTVNPDNGERTEVDKVVFTKLTEATRRQRFGRTGRTNNGLATIIEFKNASFVHSKPEWTEAAIGASLLRSGAPASIVGTYFPESLKLLWTNELPSGIKETAEAFAERYEMFQKALKMVSQKSYRPALDAGERLEFQTVSGNTIPSGRLPPNFARGDDIPVPSTVDDVHRFIVGASKWMVDRNVRLSEQQIIAFLRTEHLSWKTFVKAFEDDEWYDNGYIGVNFEELEKSENPAFAGWTDPTIRFGRRVGPKGAKIDIRPWKDSAYFDNPKPLN